MQWQKEEEGQDDKILMVPAAPLGLSAPEHRQSPAAGPVLGTRGLSFKTKQRSKWVD